MRVHHILSSSHNKDEEIGLHTWSGLYPHFGAIRIDDGKEIPLIPPYTRVEVVFDEEGIIDSVSLDDPSNYR